MVVSLSRRERGRGPRSASTASKAPRSSRDPLLLVVADEADAPGQGLAAAPGHAGVDQGVEHPAFRQPEAGHHRHRSGGEDHDHVAGPGPPGHLAAEASARPPGPAPCARRGVDSRNMPGGSDPAIGVGQRRTRSHTRISSWSATTSRPRGVPVRGDPGREPLLDRRAHPAMVARTGGQPGPGGPQHVVTRVCGACNGAPWWSGLPSEACAPPRRCVGAATTDPDHRRSRAPPSLRSAAAVEADPDRQGRTR